MSLKNYDFNILSGRNAIKLHAGTQRIFFVYILETLTFFGLTTVLFPNIVCSQNTI